MDGGDFHDHPLSGAESLDHTSLGDYGLRNVAVVARLNSFSGWMTMNLVMARRMALAGVVAAVRPGLGASFVDRRKRAPRRLA